jgi:RNA polymerase sigma factor (TIGR02999 family)
VIKRSYKFLSKYLFRPSQAPEAMGDRRRVTIPAVGETEPEITRLLSEWRNGNAVAFDQLAPAVYEHLHSVAEGYLQGERQGNTLQATALVNEVFLRLMTNQSIQYSSREHFFAFSAKVMRRILVEQARRRQSLKRGRGAQPIALAPELAWVDAASPELLDLDRAMDELEAIDETRVRTLEIRFFLGATSTETAELLNRSRSSVDREIAFSVSWLRNRLRGGRPEQNSSA